MIPTVTLVVKGQDIYTAPVIQGGFSDLLQLTQPRKPITTDWAEEPRLDTVQTWLQPQPTRPLKTKLWLPKGLYQSDIRYVDTIRVGYDRLYPIKIRSTYVVDSYNDESVYAISGTIQQSKTPPTTDPTAVHKQTTAPKEYTLSPERIALATFGASPLEGWQSALQDKTAYKETSPEASRDVVLPILLQGDTFAQLLTARDTLDALLYRRTRNQLTTPYGTYSFFFARSRVREYNITDKPYIIYDLTLTLV